MTDGRIRVGLDVTPVVTAKTGLRRYAAELWQGLAARPDVDVSAFALGRGDSPDIGLPVRRVPVPLRVLRPTWRLLGRPRAELFAGDVDVVHSIAFHPAPTRLPRAQTIHDLLPLTHSELYPAETIRIYREELRAAADADLVITTCEATAAEIERVGGIPRERVAIAPPGAFVSDGAPASPAPEARYVLAVGLVTPRKGLGVLARAAAKLGRHCPRILVAGPDWWRADDVRSEIARFDTARAMTLLGPVSDDHLAALYENATVVCHPSLAEGFGIPCLEAMTAGTALVASDLPSVRELANDAALLVPPGDADALADALAHLLADDDARAQLAASGRARAAAFSWERTAAEVAAAYHRVVG